MTSQSDPTPHLQRQLLLSVRVASDRIAELEKTVHAYEAVIKSFEVRAKALKAHVRQLQYWPWVALLATALAVLFQLPT